MEYLSDLESFKSLLLEGSFNKEGGKRMAELLETLVYVGAALVVLKLLVSWLAGR